MKKNKSTIDTNSIHKGLIDNYNIDDPKDEKRCINQCTGFSKCSRIN